MYSKRWWQQERHAIYDNFGGDPQQGVKRWLQAFAGALIAWEIGTCKKLVNEPFPFPASFSPQLALFERGIQAIEDETYLPALEMLNYLVQSTHNNVDRAVLLIFMGRIYLYKALDYGKARELFERAEKLAPDDGLPFAAQGDYYLALRNTGQAQSLYQRAVEISPNGPNGYVGLGMLAEAQSAWDEAVDWYGEAIEVAREEKDTGVALSKLLAPVTGNLFMRLAQDLSKKRALEQALKAVTRALALGIKERGEFPECSGYRLKGEILEQLGRSAEASMALYEAGRRFGWRGEAQTAVELLTRAQQLNQEDVRVYWELADALRVASYRTQPPYADEASIEKSLDAWEAAASMEQPGCEASTIYSLPWSYSERALINEQRGYLSWGERWSLWWEAIAHLERALLLNTAEPQYWMLMGRYYRLLKVDANSLYATGKAVAENSNNVAFLDERAAILANVGRYDKTEVIAGKRRGLEPNVWIDAVDAYAAIHKGDYTKAHSNLENAVKEQSDNIWYCSLLALSYRLIKRPGDAKAQYEKIWSYYHEDKPDLSNLSNFGAAAYHLDKLDDAIKIYSSLLEDPLLKEDARWSLGLCYLARGDIDDGVENMKRGIALTKDASSLDDMIQFDLPRLEQSSLQKPFYEQVQSTLVGIKEAILARKKQLGQQAIVEDSFETLIQELKQVIHEHPLKENEINWTWIGVQAGLARLYMQQEQWNEAAVAYRLLQQQKQRFPEARTGLAVIFDSLLAKGDVALKQKSALASAGTVATH